MLRYDVFYYEADGRRERGFDSNVSESYLLDVSKYLLPGGSAYARCRNGGRDNDREIDASGLHPATLRYRPIT